MKPRTRPLTRALVVALLGLVLAGCGGGGGTTTVIVNNGTTVGSLAAVDEEESGSLSAAEFDRLLGADFAVFEASQLSEPAQARCLTATADDPACLAALNDAMNRIQLTTKTLSTIYEATTVPAGACADSLKELIDTAMDYWTALSAYARAVNDQQLVVVTDEALTTARGAMPATQAQFASDCS